MKTLDELYNEIIADDNLKQQFLDAVQNGTIEAFMKSCGCDASAEDVVSFLENRNKGIVELSEEELGNVAGGYCNNRTIVETGVSLIGGFGCALMALNSACVNGMHTGQRNSMEGRICNNDARKTNNY